MLICGGRVVGMHVSLLEPPLPILPTHPSVLTLACEHRASSTSLILRFPLKLEVLFGVSALTPTVGDRYSGSLVLARPITASQLSFPARAPLRIGAQTGQKTRDRAIASAASPATRLL